MTLVNRRTEYRESLRSDILDAARQLFVRDGYHATSMRAIAGKVGCSPGILYHYFESKPAIMARLVRETFQHMRARLAAIRDDGEAPPLDRLRRILRAYIEFGLDHTHQYALLFMKPDLEIEENSPIRAAFHEDGLQTFACLREICGDAIRARALREELSNAEEVAQVLWVSIHGLVSLQIGSKGFPWIERSRLVDRLIDVLIRGVVR
ncbi:MAG: TetR/AcrR family transcriptional regulator [Bryobacteraceae bacterium]|nr:TetR/AcrR family transcriptional regulator [Bryobacteraceae bacterium]